MKVKPARWEFGSEFHWTGLGTADATSSTSAWGSGACFTGSGRDALRVLLRHGKRNLDWSRVFVPSFLCQEVVAAIRDEGFEVMAYFDDPRAAVEVCAPAAHEVLVVVNTFGTRSRVDIDPASSGGIIEDHTHDPWSGWAMSSSASYCVTEG